MIIEQNVPAPVRTWAYCQVKIRSNERTIRLLEEGKPIDYASFVLIKMRGRARYREECCKPMIARLKRRNARYRDLAERSRQKNSNPPENWLLSKNEALNLIGSTLHYRIHGKDVYDTLLRCSEDGERIFSSKFNSSNGLDPLSLLSLGFGEAL